VHERFAGIGSQVLLIVHHHRRRFRRRRCEGEFWGSWNARAERSAGGTAVGSTIDSTGFPASILTELIRTVLASLGDRRSAISAAIPPPTELPTSTTSCRSNRSIKIE
jgi:hypothetical protein